MCTMIPWIWAVSPYFCFLFGLLFLLFPLLFSCFSIPLFPSSGFKVINSIPFTHTLYAWSKSFLAASMNHLLWNASMNHLYQSNQYLTHRLLHILKFHACPSFILNVLVSDQMSHWMLFCSKPSDFIPESKCLQWPIRYQTFCLPLLPNLPSNPPSSP